MVIAFRVVYLSHDELVRGDAALERDEREVAVAHYRRAIRWFAPLSPYPVRAIDRLERLAELAELEGDASLALGCHRSIRAGLMAARSVYAPHGVSLDRANRNIARIVAHGPRPPMDAARDVASLEAEHLRMLESTRRPSLFFVVLALAGFGTWVLAAHAFATRAIDDDDRIVSRPARLYAAVFVTGFLLFVVGLRFA